MLCSYVHQTRVRASNPVAAMYNSENRIATQLQLPYGLTMWPRQANTSATWHSFPSGGLTGERTSTRTVTIGDLRLLGLSTLNKLGRSRRSRFIRLSRAAAERNMDFVFWSCSQRATSCDGMPTSWRVDHERKCQTRRMCVVLNVLMTGHEPPVLYSNRDIPLDWGGVLLHDSLKAISTSYDGGL